MTIKKLKVSVYEKIAAGEVVDRPLSIVKELAENSLDAGAKKITVSLHDGGRQMIRVQDDGCGMNKSDLLMSIEPHATSKLSEFGDLETLSSFGFRGEALYSIACSAALSIISRHQSEDHAWRMTTSSDTQPTLEPDSLSSGTVTQISELFAMMPARRKYLGSARKELLAVQEYMLTQALEYPDTSFCLIHEGKQLWKYPAADSFHVRVRDMHGADFIKKCFAVNTENTGLKIEGLVTLPQEGKKKKPPANHTDKWTRGEK